MEGTHPVGGEVAVYAAKALDALERHAAGIAGGCRLKAVKQPPGVPHGEWAPPGPPEAWQRSTKCQRRSCPVRVQCRRSGR